MGSFFRIIAAGAVCALLAGVALAQERPLGGQARFLDGAVRDISGWDGGSELDLSLSQGVPWRAFTLTDPPRLVLDFREVDWRGADAAAMDRSEAVSALRMGPFRSGWSRLVAELSGPMIITRAGMTVSEETGTAALTLRLAGSSAEAMAARSGLPRDPRWDLPDAKAKATPHRGAGAPLRIVLDPGHGGIDPGAEAGGTNEKTLMLAFARELREELLRAGGFEVVLTRADDHFVSLERRIALAHRAAADVFISLHADALSEGQAHGATIYVLSNEASDVASRKLAERHDRDDLIAGVDLSGSDDQIADVLLDMARQETQPRTEALAQSLANGMAQQGGPMNRRPVRRASFSVLKAADIPSVLIELGFLSSPRDLKNLKNPEWRSTMARGIRQGLQVWRQQDLARRGLIGQ